MAMTILAVARIRWIIRIQAAVAADAGKPITWYPRRPGARTAWKTAAYIAGPATRIRCRRLADREGMNDWDAIKFNGGGENG